MLAPSIFGENLFDDFFGGFPFYDDRDFGKAEKKLYGKNAGHLMKPDIRETDEGYEIMIDLPGFKKEEVKASLEDGYLTLSAAKGLDKSEEKKEGHYIRKERYEGACQRSFYVGTDVTEEDINTYNPRYASSVLKKLLESAIANAENNNGMSADNLYVAACYANKGPTMKRIQPRAQGRAYRIEKRTSHITIVLDER